MISSSSLTTPHTSCGHRGEVRTGREKAQSELLALTHIITMGWLQKGEKWFYSQQVDRNTKVCLCLFVVICACSELLPHEEAERLNDVKFLVQQLYTTLRIEEHQLGKERELIARLEDLNSQLRPLEKVELSYLDNHESKCEA